MYIDIYELFRDHKIAAKYISQIRSPDVDSDSIISSLNHLFYEYQSGSLLAGLLFCRGIIESVSKSNLYGVDLNKKKETILLDVEQSPFQDASESVFIRFMFGENTKSFGDLFSIFERFTGDDLTQSTRDYFNGFMKYKLSTIAPTKLLKEKLYLESLNHLKLSCTLGNPHALSFLIDVHLSNGEPAEAEILASQFPDLKSPRLDYQKVLNYFKNGYKGKEKELYLLIEKTTSAGCVGASFFKALAFYQGIYVSRNLDEAAKYFINAIKYDDDVSAMVTLGKMYVLGQFGAKSGFFGSKPNVEKGIELIKKAVERNSIEGSFVLGYLYFVGTHISKNRVLGVQLLKKSAELGNPDAIKFLKSVSL